MTQKTYSNKSNAKRAAVKELGTHATEGMDYTITRNDAGKYAWTIGKPPAAKPTQSPAAAVEIAKKGMASVTTPAPVAPVAKAVALPREGTRRRFVFDLMRRPEGVTGKEINSYFEYSAGWAVDGREWAAKYGLTFKEERDGRYVRYWLLDADD